MHVAIIMDGNGRWATRRGMPRTAGHRAGAKALTRIVEAAPQLGVKKLTVFAFSSDNWRRPAAEVDALMRLFSSYLSNEAERRARKGTRLSVIGRRDRLPPGLSDEISRVEAATADGDRLHLRVALDYSARDAISRILIAGSGRDPPSHDRIGRLISQSADDDASAPDVDLLDSDRRRKAPFRFPALGMRLCRVGVSGRDVARLHACESRWRDRGFPPSRTSLRRPHAAARDGDSLTSGAGGSIFDLLKILSG